MTYLPPTKDLVLTP